MKLRATLGALLLGLTLTPLVPSASAALSCKDIALRSPQNGHSTTPPPPAPRLFAKDFTAPRDCEWGFPLGGWGGIKKGLPAKHDPVIFVHGNHSDAVDWYGVADAFRARGYTDQELWAISYNGLGGQVDGAPVNCPCPPTKQQIAYVTRPDVLLGLATGGQYAANDVNVRDLAAFIDAVLAYTRAKQVQLVGHSLGVTVMRKTLFDYPRLMPRVSALVSIAGGNHGTSLCRGSETLLYGCDEIAPEHPVAQAAQRPGRDAGPDQLHEHLQRDQQPRPLLRPGAWVRRPARPAPGGRYQPHLRRRLPLGPAGPAGHRGDLRRLHGQARVGEERSVT